MISNKTAAPDRLHTHHTNQVDVSATSSKPVEPCADQRLSPKEPSVQTTNRIQRNAFKLALVSVCALGASVLGGAALAATTNASATTTIVAPMTITKAFDLAFGKFATSGAGTLTVSTSGVRTFSGGVTVLTGVTPTAGKFDVTGDSTSTFSVSFAGTSANLTSGANTLAFAPASDLNAGNTTSGNITTGTLVAGVASIYVGGVLTVGAAQPAGTYTGTVTALVDYN
jgi:hypothetical protein